MKTSETPEIVTYSTFVRDLTESKVSDVSIYSYGGEVDLTYLTNDGVLRGAKGSIGLDEDALLSSTLASKDVPFTIHSAEYSGSGWSWDWAMNIGSFAFFLIPILMLIVISRQSQTIKSLGEALVQAAKKQEAEQAVHGNTH
jgi:hypothetical protein